MLTFKNFKFNASRALRFSDEGILIKVLEKGSFRTYVNDPLFGLTLKDRIECQGDSVYLFVLNSSKPTQAIFSKIVTHI